MKKIFTVISLLFVALAATAQKVRCNINFIADTANIEKVYVCPLNFDESGKTTPMRKKADSFTGTVTRSPIDFYELVVVKERTQLIVPVYGSDAKELALDVKIDNKRLYIDNTRENRALSSLTRAINNLDRALWLETNMESERMKALIAAYQISLDSILAQDDITGNVAEYMTVYAYTHAYSAYTSIPRAQEIPVTSIPFGRSDILPDADIAFDNSYAPLFFSAMQVVKEDLTTSPSLLDKLHTLYAKYNNSNVRSKVASMVIGEFLSKYDYSRDFEEGLELIKTATERYELPDLYINEFLKNKSTIPGSSFPEGIVLVDEAGKKVDFSEFKGKYVYLDLWASWCGPCCKEVPYMKSLEAELKNKDVVFVSVSCDTDVQAWKNKMKELGMHGHHLLDSENALGDALNVRGIPFYLIYDKEGNLHTYGAKRPSTGRALREVLEGLK